MLKQLLNFRNGVTVVRIVFKQPKFILNVHQAELKQDDAVTCQSSLFQQENLNNLLLKQE